MTSPVNRRAPVSRAYNYAAVIHHVRFLNQMEEALEVQMTKYLHGVGGVPMYRGKRQRIDGVHTCTQTQHHKLNVYIPSHHCKVTRTTQTYPPHFINHLSIHRQNVCVFKPPNVFRTMFVRFLPCERVMRMDCCLFVESQAEHVRLFDHMIS